MRRETIAPKISARSALSLLDVLSTVEPVLFSIRVNFTGPVSQKPGIEPQRLQTCKQSGPIGPDPLA
jgi:hypothetical protein